MTEGLVHFPEFQGDVFQTVLYPRVIGLGDGVEAGFPNELVTFQSGHMYGLCSLPADFQI